MHRRRFKGLYSKELTVIIFQRVKLGYFLFSMFFLNLKFSFGYERLFFFNKKKSSELFLKLIYCFYIYSLHAVKHLLSKCAKLLSSRDKQMFIPICLESFTMFKSFKMSMDYFYNEIKTT